MPPKDECPLCPAGHGSVPSEIPESDYQVVVFENRFPSYAVTSVGADAPDPSGIFGTRPAVGRCEVVCFTSNHESSFKDLPVDRVRTVIDTWAQRTEALGALPEVEHVFAFENRGREIGVTLPHPHGQIYAYPYLPDRTKALLEAARRHHERTGRLLGADILAAERADGSRVVVSGTHWTAYVPFAARWPVEVHLAPHRDVPDLVALDDDERDEPGRRLPRPARAPGPLLRRRGRVARQACPTSRRGSRPRPRPGATSRGCTCRLMSVLRGPGRLKFLAGSESGVGGWVNDVAPERAAARLREVAP